MKSLGAALAVPALPAKALMGGVAPAARVSATPALYNWAKMITQVHGRCSTGMLVSMLKVEPRVALGLYEKLIANGVVTGANALGMSRVVAPIAPTHVGGHVAAKPVLKARPLGAFFEDQQGSGPEQQTDSLCLNQTAPNSEHELDDPISPRGDPDQPRGAGELDSPDPLAPGGSGDVSAPNARKGPR